MKKDIRKEEITNSTQETEQQVRNLCRFQVRFPPANRKGKSCLETERAGARIERKASLHRAIGTACKTMSSPSQ